MKKELQIKERICTVVFLMELYVFAVVMYVL